MSERKELAFELLITAMLLSVMILATYMLLGSLTGQDFTEWFNNVPF